MKSIIAYVPVLHEGYRMFFEKHKNADFLYIFGEDIISEFDYLSKEIRALSPEYVRTAIESWEIHKVFVLNKKDIDTLKADQFILPREDVCRQFAEKYLKNKEVFFDNVFLRWDRSNVKKVKKITSDKVITKNEFLNLAFLEAEKSSDWWRRVGSVLVKDKKVVLSAFNQHFPSPHSPYVDGDPRNVSHKNKDLGFFTSIHAEAKIIAEAAKKGISLDGSEIYVTDFPCPVCAKQIAFSGIKKLYYYRGYNVLDGERILKHKGVEIIKIKE